MDAVPRSAEDASCRRRVGAADVRKPHQQELREVPTRTFLETRFKMRHKKSGGVAMSESVPTKNEILTVIRRRA